MTAERNFEDRAMTYKTNDNMKMIKYYEKSMLQIDDTVFRREYLTSAASFHLISAICLNNAIMLVEFV